MHTQCACKHALVHTQCGIYRICVCCMYMFPLPTQSRRVSPFPTSQYPRAQPTPISPGFSLCVSVVACLISYYYVPFSHSVSCSFIILIPTVYCAKRVWCLYSNVLCGHFFFSFFLCSGQAVCFKDTNTCKHTHTLKRKLGDEVIPTAHTDTH